MSTEWWIGKRYFEGWTPLDFDAAVQFDMFSAVYHSMLVATLFWTALQMWRLAKAQPKGEFGEVDMGRLALIFWAIFVLCLLGLWHSGETWSHFRGAWSWTKGFTTWPSTVMLK